MRIRSMREIPPKESRCIEVDSEDRLYAVGGRNGQEVLTHNSVVQRNVVLGCILRPEHWYFAGVDLKRVELSWLRSYSNVVVGIATELEVAVEILRLASQIMMKRYSTMEEMGVADIKDMPGDNKFFMVMVDEAAELLAADPPNNDEGKIIKELIGEAKTIISSIARLGRAAGVHITLATQQPRAEIFSGDLRPNLGYRVNCGTTDSSTATMILGPLGREGPRVSPNPQGRLYLGIYSRGNHGQGLFAKQSFAEEYLASQGLNVDGTPMDDWTPPDGQEDTRIFYGKTPLEIQAIKEGMDETKSMSDEMGVDVRGVQKGPQKKIGTEDVRPEDTWSPELEDIQALNR